MIFTPEHMQIAGIVVLVAIGLAMLWWIVHIVLGLHRGRPIYILPETSEDDDDDDNDDDHAESDAG
jgi:hypothetical protein